MDRFIETGIILSLLEHSYLKSNMDRFIEQLLNSFEPLTFLFKIQYG